MEYSSDGDYFAFPDLDEEPMPGSSYSQDPEWAASNSMTSGSDDGIDPFLKEMPGLVTGHSFTHVMPSNDPYLPCKDCAGQDLKV